MNLRKNFLRNGWRRKKLKQETNYGLTRLKLLSQSDNTDLIVVDEILGCIQNNLIKEQDLIEILKNKKDILKLHYLVDMHLLP